MLDRPQAAGLLTVTLKLAWHEGSPHPSEPTGPCLDPQLYGWQPRHYTASALPSSLLYSPPFTYFSSLTNVFCPLTSPHQLLARDVNTCYGHTPAWAAPYPPQILSDSIGESSGQQVASWPGYVIILSLIFLYQYNLSIQPSLTP